MSDFAFDFYVEGIDRETAERIMDSVVEIVEAAGGHVGGGFHLAEEGADDMDDVEGEEVGSAEETGSTA